MQNEESAVQATPRQLYDRAKQDRHKYNISSEAFTNLNRNFVISNISLKKDYVDEFDLLNYRRGFATLEEIIEFKHTPLQIARKGLRKFTDMMPEYLQIRESQRNRSRQHNSVRNSLFNEIEKGKFQSFVIYNTQKLNGQNAQISLAFDRFWIIGSKNKCLLFSEESDIEHFRNKTQHKLTLLIAKAWFSLLKAKTQQQMSDIRQELSKSTLVGQYCNSQNMQHLVDYGKNPQLFFYALVDNQNRSENCQPSSNVFKFLQKTNLPAANSTVFKCESKENLIAQLKDIVIKTSQLSMKEGGQGSVLYVSGVNQNQEKNVMVSKVKTIQYRIYRKLREKLKTYIQKFNKHYDGLLKKFKKQVEQIARQFTTKRPIDEYIQTARKSFILCEDQTRQVSRFVHNKFIYFLKLVQKGITKDKFTQIVNDKQWEMSEQYEEIQRTQSKQEEINQIEQSQNLKPLEVQKQKNQNGLKKVIVLIPVTIPSTGKTSLLELMSTFKPSFLTWSISSDQVRNKIMQEMMKKMKNMSREQAFKKSRQKANKQYYKNMADTFKKISESPQASHLFYLDKNHPESALKETIKQINQNSSKFSNIKTLKVVLLPSCDTMQQKGRFKYPFSAAYILTCLKRVLQRPQHLTLQGSNQDRCKIVLGFTNLFRNYSRSNYNLAKNFDRKLEFKFHNEKCITQLNNDMTGLLMQILLGSKPGDFEYTHPQLQILVKMIDRWDLVQIPRQQCAQQALKSVEKLFDDFEGSKLGQNVNK